MVLNLKGVKDYRHFQNLIKEAKELNGHLRQTNLYLFGKDLQELIENGLVYLIVDGGICFFEKQPMNYKLYYMISKEITSIEVKTFPTIVEFIERNVTKIESTQSFLVNSGFKRKAIHNEMIKPIIDSDRFNEDSIVSHANMAELDEILKLWTSHLDITSHPLPAKEKLSSMIQMGQIYVIRDMNHGIIAAMNKRLENTVLFIEYVVVSREFQSKGYGRKLLDSCYKAENISKVRLFVNNTNHKAIRFYVKNGFEATGKQLIQFYK